MRTGPSPTPIQPALWSCLSTNYRWKIPLKSVTLLLVMVRPVMAALY